MKQRCQILNSGNFLNTVISFEFKTRATPSSSQRIARAVVLHLPPPSSQPSSDRHPTHQSAIKSPLIVIAYVSFWSTMTSTDRETVALHTTASASILQTQHLQEAVANAGKLLESWRSILQFDVLYPDSTDYHNVDLLTFTTLILHTGIKFHFNKDKYPTMKDGWLALRRDIQLAALKTGAVFVSSGGHKGKKDEHNFKCCSSILYRGKYCEPMDPLDENDENTPVVFRSTSLHNDRTNTRRRFFLGWELF